MVNSRISIYSMADVCFTGLVWLVLPLLPHSIMYLAILEHFILCCITVKGSKSRQKCFMAHFGPFFHFRISILVPFFSKNDAAKDLLYALQLAEELLLYHL